jgi:hypothetical protein
LKNVATEIISIPVLKFLDAGNGVLSIMKWIDCKKDKTVLEKLLMYCGKMPKETG